MVIHLSRAAETVLRRAASRTPGYVCPTCGLHGAAQASVLVGLRAHDFITDGPAPVITEAGRAWVADHRW